MTKYIIRLMVACMTVCFHAQAQSIYPGQHGDKIKIGNEAPVKVQSFDLKDVRLLPGRVHDNLSRDSAWMADISVNRLLHSFRNNAGVYAGLEGGYESVKKLGGWESLDCDLRGHTTGHLLSAFALMNAATGSNLFKLKGDSLVAGLAEVQKALGTEGYLSAFPEELINRNLQGKGVWAPWYTLHKIMAGLIDQYLYTDNEQALAVAIGMGNWAFNKLNRLPDDTRRLMLRNEFGGMNEAFYNLYCVTADARYLALARFFYHDDVIDPLKHGETDFGTKHTNTFIPKVIAEARNYELNQNNESHDLVQLFWREMTRKHCFVTGSSSQKEHFFDPERMSEYINGYTGETCCTYNMLKLSHHLFCWDADREVADYYERALYNHILSQQDTMTSMVCYFLPLMSGAYKVYSTPEQSFWCCVGSGFESHAKYGEAIYYHRDDELLVNLFIPSRLSWADKGFTIRQLTEFPESDEVTILIDEAPTEIMSLSLRNPSWSGEPVVTINGKQVSNIETSSDYLTLRRKWHSGDKITVRYPMTLRLERVHNNPRRGALTYGPIVLAGNLGTEGMKTPAPFSDPTVRNDYYTYEYNIPISLPTHLKISDSDIESIITRIDSGLHFQNADGVQIAPLYDLHHTRYVVYWDLD